MKMAPTDLSLFEQILLVISKIMQILSTQAPILKVFLDKQNTFFLTEDQFNFGNKIPFEFQQSKTTFSKKYSKIYPLPKRIYNSHYGNGVPAMVTS